MKKRPEGRQEERSLEEEERGAGGRAGKGEQARGEEKKMCSPGWPRTRDPPASASFSKSYRCAPLQPAWLSFKTA